MRSITCLLFKSSVMKFLFACLLFKSIVYNNFSTVICFLVAWSQTCHETKMGIQLTAWRFIRTIWRLTLSLAIILNIKALISIIIFACRHVLGLINGYDPATVPADRGCVNVLAMVWLDGRGTRKKNLLSHSKEWNIWVGFKG